MSLREAQGTISVEDALGLIDRQERAARKVLNMVPSENSMSAFAKLPLILDVYHRYFFNDREDPDDWNFRGAQDAAPLETRLALELLRELTCAEHVNLRPLSGLSGMALILGSLGGPPGSDIVTVAPEQGGHYATRDLAERLGLRVSFITGPDPHTIDLDEVARMLRACRPRLIYIDQSNCLFPLDVATLGETIRDAAPEAILHVDASHWMGLILGRRMPNPLDAGADSFGGSTHKSFPGPQKAIFATRRADLAAAVRATQFWMISSHHFAAAVALGLALLEFKHCDGEDYAARVVDNTVGLGHALAARGIDVLAAERGFSGGHQLWIRTMTSGVDASDASRRLHAAGLRVNAFPELPGLHEPCLRIGVNEATWLGIRDEDLDELADIFANAVGGRADAAALAAQVAALRARHVPPYTFATRRPDVVARAAELVRSAVEGTAPLATYEPSRPS